MRLVWLVLLLPAAAAFTSLPPGASPHDDITRDAAEAVGWPDEGVPALLEAVRAPDVEDHQSEPHADDLGRIGTTDTFRAFRHCDRVPPEDNATAFAATAQYIDEQRRAAAAAQEAREKVQAIGRALHALQDCFSHSNYVDLDEAAQQQFTTALLNAGDAPPGTILTAFAPGHDEPGRPDDPYPHDAYAKDSPDKNEESQAPSGNGTKYDAARNAAVQASAALMAAFLGPLGADERQAIADLRPLDTSGDPTASAGAWVAGLALLAVAVARR